jgi:hypothetical protein
LFPPLLGGFLSDYTDFESVASTILEKKIKKFFNPSNNSGSDFKIFFYCYSFNANFYLKKRFIFLNRGALFSWLATCCRTFIDFSYRLLPVVPLVVERKEGEDESADNCSLLSI